jgi:ADP-heptose:LPS heptosyltransferase
MRVFPAGKDRGRIRTTSRMKVSFVIRAKMCDTLIAYASVRQYADLYPEDEVTLLVRKDYARLLQDEPGIRLISFDSRIEMMLKLLWLRLKGETFDVLAILWGYGNPIRRIGQLVNARRKISMDGSFPEIFTEHPPSLDYEQLLEQSWLVIRVFRPEFPKPDELRLPGLARRRQPETLSSGPIAVVPLSAENRKNMDSGALDMLLRRISEVHPGRRIWIFVNPTDAGAASILKMPLPSFAEFKRFGGLVALARAFEQVSHWYGADTGLYHLAAGMGVPATVFFGPTQPGKVLMSAQPGVQWVRAQVLANDHCEEKSCTKPLCLHRAVAGFCDSETSTTLRDVPAACPLRRFSESELRDVAVAQAGRG